MQHSILKITALVCLALLAHPGQGAAQTAADQYCKLDTSGYTLLLVDMSDQWADDDQRLFYDGAIRVMEELMVGGDRLAVHTISDKPGAVLPEFSRCVPGCNKVRWSFTDAKCSGNTLQAAQNAVMQEYTSAVEKIIKKNAHVDPQTGSNITESLHNIWQEYRGKNLKRIVIFSDMLENSVRPNGSFYNLNSDRLVDAYLNGLQADTLFPNLNGTAIKVFGFGRKLMGRSGQDSSRELSTEVRQTVHTFWNRYFRHTGAASLDMTYQY